MEWNRLDTQYRGSRTRGRADDLGMRSLGTVHAQCSALIDYEGDVCDEYCIAGSWKEGFYKVQLDHQKVRKAKMDKEKEESGIKDETSE